MLLQYILSSDLSRVCEEVKILAAAIAGRITAATAVAAIRSKKNIAADMLKKS